MEGQEQRERPTLLPVCCHPVLDCREFRLEHVWDRRAEQGRGWALASLHSQLLLLLNYPALLKSLDLSSGPAWNPPLGIAGQAAPA